MAPFRMVPFCCHGCSVSDLSCNPAGWGVCLGLEHFNSQFETFYITSMYVIALEKRQGVIPGRGERQFDSVNEKSKVCGTAWVPLDFPTCLKKMVKLFESRHASPGALVTNGRLSGNWWCKTSVHSSLLSSRSSSSSNGQRLSSWESWKRSHRLCEISPGGVCGSGGNAHFSWAVDCLTVQACTRWRPITFYSRSYSRCSSETLWSYFL